MKRTLIHRQLFPAKIIFIICSLIGLLSPARSASADTAFTYQGQLNNSSGAVTGVFDFQFILYDADSGGNQVGPTVTLEDINVSNGIFTTTLDFGNVFDGSAMFLKMAVRPGSSTGEFTALSPRQALTATPQALFSAQAPWAGLSSVPEGFADGVDDDTLAELQCGPDQIPVWNGSTWVCADYWSLSGNANVPSNAVLGTTDDRPLKLIVNNQPAL